MLVTAILVVASAEYRQQVEDATVIYVAEAKEEEIETIPDEVVETQWDEQTIKAEVWSAAAKYNTFPEKMWATVKCENPVLDPLLQSYIVKDGVREDSWGLAQFYLPAKNRTVDGDVITKEMAQDVVTSLDAMAYHFSIGNAKLWSCYKKIYM